METSIAATCQDLDSQIVIAGYTRAQLSAAFSLVEDPANWKNPIRAIIPEADTDVETIKKIFYAVVFFTGSQPTFRQVPSSLGTMYIVEAAGYYLTIGA
jgi:hypothetical protein